MRLKKPQNRKTELNFRKWTFNCNDVANHMNLVKMKLSICKSQTWSRLMVVRVLSGIKVTKLRSEEESYFCHNSLGFVVIKCFNTQSISYCFFNVLKLSVCSLFNTFLPHFTLLVAYVIQYKFEYLLKLWILVMSINVSSFQIFRLWNPG